MPERLAADVVASALRSLAAAPALPVAAILTTALAVGRHVRLMMLREGADPNVLLRAE